MSRLPGIFVRSISGASSPAGAEAAAKARNFFREICKEVPFIRHQYRLEELITVPALRNNVNTLFKTNADITNPKAVDMLIWKGREELEMIIRHHKQRHHLITKYVAPTQEQKMASTTKHSTFLQGFLTSNGSV